MISKKDISKLVRHIRRKDKGKSDKRLIHPTREWLIGLVVALVLCLGATAYSVSLFFTQSAAVGDLEQVETRTTKYREESVRTVLEKYGARKVQFDALRGQGVPPPVETEEDSVSGSGSGSLRAE